MRRWLALLVAATTSLVLIALLVPMALLIRSVAENGAMSRATAAAESVAVSVGTADLPLAVERVEWPVTVFLPGGRVIGEEARRTDAVELAATGRSVTAECDDGREVLVAVQSPEGTVVIRSFVSDAELMRGVREAWTALLVLGLALVVLGIALADRLARAMTGPIDGLARVSHRLAGGDLDARAEPGGPTEVRAVALALNHLAGRIGDLLAAERESVADLSHRLRTPLTGLRLDVESLRDPEEAARVGARVDALERAVSAVITDARRRSAGRESCDATAVVRERVRFWSVLAEDQGREVDVALPGGELPVAAGAESLAACVDALLGNVFAHTPEGASFSVRLAPHPKGAELVVSDTGPGFDPALLARGNSGGGSTGLGLDIARRTAESSGGGLAVSPVPSGGARVEVTLGRP
ncbi:MULTISPECIES: sensor histidine kinase [Nonomuraea]|uniref:Signal transduction histidine-protein kinase/phosphatase MprB n=1 Tax=Nonomuraea ferruginea TaxID=46174 RepID=A0ABT4T3K5_9ACTN|nr:MULTISPECIES: HAMP domain-containing sensor histidine kinase [Nonomuraea]MDA0643743.1 HAMP domain-containing sensor histidine kinase [Nonomuraea ferruginea]TXK42723.1 HAMP domain-containing histidine kinase [Nonomuraea sp. C10]